MSLIINLISRTHSYVRKKKVHIYSISEIPNNYPKSFYSNLLWIGDMVRLFYSNSVTFLGYFNRAK